MHPLPDRPLPEGWTYIEHPETGRAENPVHRNALGAWQRNGWTEVANQEQQPPAEPVAAPAAATRGGASPAPIAGQATTQVKE